MIKKTIKSDQMLALNCSYYVAISIWMVEAFFMHNLGKSLAQILLSLNKSEKKFVHKYRGYSVILRQLDRKGFSFPKSSGVHKVSVLTS